MRKSSCVLILSLICVFFYPLEAVPFRPVPWLTDGAVRFLEEFFQKHDEPSVLEFGSGSSSVWFAKRTKNLTSIEHDKDCHDLVKSKIRAMSNTENVKLILKARPYFDVCKQFSTESFDLILVDGRERVGCIKAAISLLKPGGIMMLDNSERPRYRPAFKALSAWPYFEAKQKGRDQCNFYCKGWKTSWWIKPND